MELKPSRLGGLLQVFAQESRVVFPVAVAVAVLLLPGPASRWTSPRITSSAFCHETLWLDLPRFRGFCRENQEDEVFPIPFVWLLKKRGKTLGSLFEVVKTHLYVHMYIYIYTHMLCVFLLTKKQTPPPPNFGWHVSYSHRCRLVSFVSEQHRRFSAQFGTCGMACGCAYLGYILLDDIRR